MPCYGGLTPSPRRMGGGTPRAKLILDSLIAARGTAIKAGDRSSIAYVETLAVARAIAAAWGTNQRLANQWDARRMTSMLSRWEAIFDLRSHPDDDDSTRRHQIELAQARVGRAAILTTIVAELTDALGERFVAVESISLANAIIHVPDHSYPFGSVVVPEIPWASSVAHILVLVENPNGSESEFYDAMGVIADRLEPLLPAWATWDWYRAPATGTPINVVGGPSRAGFYFDDEHNLDNNVFDDDEDPASPLLRADFTALPLGPMSASTFLAATGLVFARSTVSTVQTSDATLDASPGIDEACIGNATTFDTKRGLVLEHRTRNILDGDSVSDASPRNYIRAGQPGALSTWLEGAGLTFVTVTYPSDGADQTGSGGSHIVYTWPGTGPHGTTNVGSPGFNTPHMSLSAWTKGATAQNIMMGSLGSASRAASPTWARLELHSGATAAGYYILVGDPALGSIDMYADYIQFQHGDFSTEAHAVKNASRGVDRIWKTNGSTLISASGQLKFQAKFSPKFASTMQVLWHADDGDWSGGARAQTGFYLFAWGTGTGLGPQLAVPNYAYIKDSDKKLYVKIANGTEVVSANAMAWAQYDEIDIRIGVGSGAPSLAEYRLNGGAWTDLVLAPVTEVPAPGVNPVYFMHNGPNYSAGNPLRDTGHWPCRMQYLEILP